MKQTGKKITAFVLTVIMMMTIGSAFTAASAAPADTPAQTIPVAGPRVADLESPYNVDYVFNASLYLSTPTNCGPWVYEDIIDDIMQATGVTKIAEPRPWLYNTEDDPCNDPDAVRVLISNGAQSLKPGTDRRAKSRQMVLIGEKDSYFLYIPGDIDRDGRITQDDVTRFMMYFNSPMRAAGRMLKVSPESDLNADGQVTIADIAILNQILKAGPNPNYKGEPMPEILPVHMEYEPVYESHNGIICYTCMKDLYPESQAAGDIPGKVGTVIDDHCASHMKEFQNGTAARPENAVTAESANQSVTFLRTWYNADIINQTEVVPAPKEQHMRVEVTCNVCDMNLTRNLIDPETHRMEHAAAGERFGGIGYRFFTIRYVQIPAAE